MLRQTYQGGGWLTVPCQYLPGYLKAVWPDFFGSVFGVWAAPGGFKTIQNIFLVPSYSGRSLKNAPRIRNSLNFGVQTASPPLQNAPEKTKPPPLPSSPVGF